MDTSESPGNESNLTDEQPEQKKSAMQKLGDGLETTGALLELQALIADIFSGL